LLGHVQLLVNQHPQVLLSRAALKPFIAQPVLIQRVAGPWCSTLHLAFLNLLRFTEARFSSLSRSLRHVNHPTQLGVICKLAEGALDLTMSFMKLLNSTGPKINIYIIRNNLSAKIPRSET